MISDVAEDLMNSAHKLLALFRYVGFPILQILTDCTHLHDLAFEVQRCTPACHILAVKGWKMAVVVDADERGFLLFGTHHLIEELAHCLILFAIIKTNYE
jgi:hypothetical protein